MQPVRVGFVFAASVSCFAPLVAAQDAAAVAQVRYQDGVTLFTANRFAEAESSFRASIAAFDSPNSRLMLARALRERGRLPQALAEYQRAQHQAEELGRTSPRYRQTAQSARTEGAELAPRLGTLVLRWTASSPPPATLSITVAAEPLPLVALGVAIPVLAAPERVHVSVTARGFLPFEQDVTVAARSTTELPVQMRALENFEGVQTTDPTAAAPPSALRPQTIIGWTSIGVGGASLLTSAVSLAIAQTLFANLERRCSPNPCGNAAVDDARFGATLDAVWIGTAIVGTLAIATGVTLLRVGNTRRTSGAVSLQPRGAMLQWVF